MKALPKEELFIIFPQNRLKKGGIYDILIRYAHYKEEKTYENFKEKHTSTDRGRGFGGFVCLRRIEFGRSSQPEFLAKLFAKLLEHRFRQFFKHPFGQFLRRRAEQ